MQRDKDHKESGKKETNKTPITDPKKMEIYELTDKDFRINLS